MNTYHHPVMRNVVCFQPCHYLAGGGGGGRSDMVVIEWAPNLLPIDTSICPPTPSSQGFDLLGREEMNAYLLRESPIASRRAYFQISVSRA